MPYASKAQQRFFHAAEARGKIDPSTVKDFDRATDFSHLPEKSKGKEKKHSRIGHLLRKKLGHKE